MNNKWQWAILIFAALIIPIQATDLGDYLKNEKGIQLLKEKKYKESLEKFQEISKSKENGSQGHYNLGNVYYKQENYDEAIKNYQQAMVLSKDTKKTAQIIYNLGNTLIKKGQIEPAIERYKKALEINPEDQDIRYNLEYALRQLQQQQKQENENQDKNEKQDQKQDKKEKNKEDEDNQDPKKDQNNQKEEGKENEGEKEKENQQKNNPSKETDQPQQYESNAILNALEEIEKNAKIKYQMQAKTKADVEFDW